MSKLNINRNVFLEKEELVNFQSFFANNMLFQALLQATFSFGIITNNPAKANGSGTAPDNVEYNDPFIVQQGSVANSIKVLPGMAINSLGQFIKIDVEDNIQVPNDSLFYWVKIAYATRNYELGIVSVNTKGVVFGTADFSGKVRGQSTSTPTCIRFIKDDGSIPLNNGIYQVVNVIDNQNLVLTSNTTFVAESNLRPIVLGTLPIGGVFSQSQREGLYIYDYYEISLVQETSVETPPEKGNNEFYIARIKNTNGTFTIDNTVKSEYWALGNLKATK